MQIAQDIYRAGAPKPRFVRLDLPRQTAIAINGLERFGALSEAEAFQIRDAVMEADSIPASGELIAEGEPLKRARVLLSGWAARIRFLSDGRRQIVAFHLPGDLYGYSDRPGATAPCATIALTPTLSASLLGEGMERSDFRNGFGMAVSRALALDEAYLLNQLVRVGRQTAYERCAHLILELFYRLKAVSHNHDDSFVLPLTQETLSDALGLSVVHTNRTLQQLRRDRLIETKNSTVCILQKERLAEIGDFKPPTWPNVAKQR